MEYIDKRNGEVKNTDYLQLVNGDAVFRIEIDNQGVIVITKIDYNNNNSISINPVFSNQIGIK